MNATPKASNLEKYQNAITRYIAEVGGNPRLIMRKQFAKLLDRVTKLTPPKTKAEGRRIVKRDIERGSYHGGTMSKDDYDEGTRE